MPFSLGRERKLRNHSEFVQAQRTGRRVSTTHFTLLVAAQPQGDGPPRCARIGFVVSRKVGPAVRRNRVKRVCRECFRLWPDLLPAGVDLVVIARPGASELNLGGVQAEWAAVGRLLRKRAAEALARTATGPHVGSHRS